MNAADRAKRDGRHFAAHLLAANPGNCDDCEQWDGDLTQRYCTECWAKCMKAMPEQPAIGPAHIVVETMRGHRVNLAAPDPATISGDDIGWALSRLARYNGHTTGAPYTVAQHSVWVSQYLQQLYPSIPVLALYGLLHDAHEAYLGDIVQPVQLLPGIKAAIAPVAEALDDAIWARLVPDKPHPRHFADFHDQVKAADRMALRCEAAVLMPSGGADWHGLPEPDPEAPPIEADIADPQHHYRCFMVRLITLCRQVGVDEVAL